MHIAYQDLFDHIIPSDEVRLINTHPLVWLAFIASGCNNDDIYELLRITENDLNQREAEAMNEEDEDGGDGDDDIVEIRE